MSRLSELYRILHSKPSSYPTAYHLAIREGCYDIGLIEEAMKKDIFETVSRSTKHLDPSSDLSFEKIQGADLIADRQIIKKEELSAKQLANKALKHRGIQSARECIRFIQQHGRNTHIAQTLVKELQPPFDEDHKTHTRYSQGSQAPW